MGNIREICQIRDIKSANAKTIEGTGAYCGKVDWLTLDHIPPSCLFVSTPLNIVEVPSCFKCNNSASSDDEYFKTMLVIKNGSGNHPTAVGLQASVFRALQKPQKIGFARAIRRSITVASIMSQGGIFLGERPAFHVDLARLDKVVRRIVKGLYWHHWKVAVPQEFKVDAFSEHGVADLSPAAKEQLRHLVIEPVLEQPVFSIGDDVLRYRFLCMSDIKSASAWCLEFYSDVRFIALVGPEY